MDGNRPSRVSDRSWEKPPRLWQPLGYAQTVAYVFQRRQHRCAECLSFRPASKQSWQFSAARPLLHRIGKRMSASCARVEPGIRILVSTEQPDDLPGLPE